MTAPAPHPFRAAVEAGDIEAAIATLAPGIVFHSPAVFHPYVGRDTVAALLRLVFETFEDFRYTDEIGGSDGTEALVFRAAVGGRELEGLDLLRTGSDGLVQDFTVMIRPLSGLLALAQALGPKVEAAGLKATGA
ncbi:nuclear transport factor 2 family protein [Baekduia soli]|uniref:Nuclear transport factor 2 family protein n=1 Tax=Baekduia soli TaxID=496014 RepID=A0A5B8U3B5_9ACTN|nr:nuclear transport factor 2 family protein [Baekduia soli]QEC47463.1 nuclear transport factor 2 family protein [Baekduia soli]